MCTITLEFINKLCSVLEGKINQHKRKNIADQNSQREQEGLNRKAVTEGRLTEKARLPLL